ncbi:MAG: DUF5017 domain-containing protein [Paludibacter sp.]
MKISILSILSSVLLFFTACQNGLENDITSFDVTAASVGSTKSGDTLIVKKATAIDFTLSGDADLITFFSGELDHKYSEDNLNRISENLISNSRLQFLNTPTDGIIPGTLKVYISTTFNGLLKNNKKADSIAVVTHNWIDITDSCKLSSTSGIASSSSYSLKKYMNDRLRLTVAFKYKTDQNTGIQPTWSIKDFKVICKYTAGDSLLFRAVSMGFTPLDMYNYTTAYANSSSKAGSWNTGGFIATPSELKILKSDIGTAMHEDWLISNPIVVNGRTPDTGLPVKPISNIVDTYQYKFSTSGVYTATFLAQRANYVHADKVLKSIIIKVVD